MVGPLLNNTALNLGAIALLEGMVPSLFTAQFDTAIKGPLESMVASTVTSSITNMRINDPMLGLGCDLADGHRDGACNDAKVDDVIDGVNECAPRPPPRSRAPPPAWACGQTRGEGGECSDT